MEADEVKGFPCKPTDPRAFSDQRVAEGLQTDLTRENENPGALAGATGAEFVNQRFTAERYQNEALKASWARLNRREKRAVRVLALTLFLGRESDFYRLAGVLNCSLTTAQRVRLAWAALCSLDPEPREHAFMAAHWGVVE